MQLNHLLFLGSVIAEYRIQYYFDNNDSVVPEDLSSRIVNVIEKNRFRLEEQNINVSEMQINDLEYQAVQPPQPLPTTMRSTTATSNKR